MAYYTRQGDKGKTSLYGGHRLNKDDLRVSTYGTVDEVNSFVGLLASYVPEDFKDVHEDLYMIQQDLFNCSSDLSTIDQDRPYKMKNDRATWLEERLDAYADEAPKIKQFILPGGSRVSAYAHVCRTTTRRCERLIVSLNKREKINASVLIYFNRLSDYFFALARALNARLDVEDRFWEQSKAIFSSGLQEEQGDK